ncbi:MAG: diguanylate cyclase [Halanaerobium sp.]
MRKNNNNHKNIIENMPVAFAYHKVIFDQNNKAVNYIFLEINKKFEELTGLKKDEIIGKKVTDVLNGITKDKFNWIQFYGEISLSGESKTIKQYSEPLDKWYKIKAYSDDEKYFTTIFSDITEDKKREQKIEKNKERYQTIFNSAPIGFMLENENGKIIEVNEVMCEDSGYSKAELEGSNVLDKMVSPEYQELAKENIKRILEGENLEFDVKTSTKDGQMKYYHLKETNITLPDGNKGIISMHLDITDRVKKEKKIEYLAYKDSLTDLYNRKFFEAELQRMDTKSKLPISIIIGDLNGLKIINDSYGQKKGDQLLRKTAKLLKEVVTKNDVLARYGGDEFTILLPQTTNKKAQKIVDRIKSKSNNKKSEITLSISLGVATKENEKQNIMEVLKQAEDEMYQNKLSESRSSKSNIVQGLLNTLNAKSSETKEHAVRMTKLAFDFGEKLNLSNSELNRLSLLATLHDIGKTTISEAILTKPAKLTKKEWEIMKDHSQKGYKIASTSEEFALVAEEILAHHENWDGSGYPHGLKGDEIPYLARIITIIDSYDVMTNDRPYSKAISKEEALKEIEDCAGSQFDPELAEEFVKLVDEDNNL